MNKKNIFFLVFFLFLLVSLVAAMPPFVVQESAGENNALQIIYPKNPAFPKDQAFKLHFHIYNSTGTQVMADDVTCLIHIYNATNNHILEANLTSDSNQVDVQASLIGAYADTTGTFPYLVYCNSTPVGQDGFLSAEYFITGSGEYLDDAAILGASLIVIAIMSFYFYLAVNWKFKLFSKQRDEQESAVKAFIVLIAIWLMTVPIQYATEIMQSTVLNDAVVLLRLFYQVQIWFNWFITIYMVIYMIYNLFLYMTKQSETGGAGKLLKT